MIDICGDIWGTILISWYFTLPCSQISTSKFKKSEEKCKKMKKQAFSTQKCGVEQGKSSKHVLSKAEGEEGKRQRFYYHEGQAVVNPKPS
jgi:hypothetical protein